MLWGCFPCLCASVVHSGWKSRASEFNHQVTKTRREATGPYFVSLCLCGSFRIWVCTRVWRRGLGHKRHGGRKRLEFYLHHFAFFVLFVAIMPGLSVPLRLIPV